MTGEGGSKPAFPDKPILVVGDFITDEFVYVNTERLSREHPIPIFEEGSAGVLDAGLPLQIAGGAGRVVKQLMAVGVPVAEAVLSRTTKQRYICRTQPHREVFRLDSRWPRRKELGALPKEEGGYSAAIFSDYQGLPPSPWMMQLLQELDCPLIGDCRKACGPWPSFDVVKVNALDLEPILPPSKTGLDTYLLEAFKARALVVTQGAEGHVVIESGGSTGVSSIASDVRNVSGAGDVFTAMLAVGIAGGLDVLAASEIAGIAAGLRVAKPEYGVVVPLEEIDEWRNANETSSG